MQLCAARGCHLRLSVPNTCPSPRSLREWAAISALAQRFADPALGELVLAYDAFGVDPQEHVHAVPGPLGYLGRVDAAVEPRGQAGVPEVIWAPRERGGLLDRGQRRLARFDPGAPAGDGRQFAAPYAVEQAAVRSCGEIGKVIPKEPGQFGMGGHDAA